MKKLFIILLMVVGLFGSVSAHATVNPVFSVTTSSVSVGTTFDFYLSAAGTFYVNCGDGGELTSNAQTNDVTGPVDGFYTVTRTNNTTQTLYTCTYTTAGNSKTISFASENVTAYNSTDEDYTGAAISFYTTSAQSLLTSISGNLSTLLPQLATSGMSNIPSFRATFYQCTHLTQIPATLFSGYTGTRYHMFHSTFYGCTGLTSIPEDLFATITTSAIYMFHTTFYGCTGLTSIPEDLFSHVTSGESNMFNSTFYGCTGLTSIPEDLFSHITSGAIYMFYSTFNGCTGLTSIPENLFSFGGNNVSGQSYMFYSTFGVCTGLTSIPKNLFAKVTSSARAMFYATFHSCTGLTGYIPPSLFAGLVKNGSPTATDMMLQTFYSTGSLATTCPAGTGQYITGYESSWSSRVSCAPFVVTTTSLSANDTFQFNISAAGNFEVNCGVGGILSGEGNAAATVSGNIITKSDTTNYTYTCTYSTPGTKTIAFSGTATGYSLSNAAAISFSTASKTSIASVAGDLSAVFPTLTSAITGASTNPNFTYTFRQCTNLTSIPGTLFAHITTGYTEMFAGTFDTCTGLTSIPGNLFANITTGADAMFLGTFSACTGLTSLPEGLFANITTGGEMMFYETFWGCTGLTGYIPPSMFSGLINESDPTQSVDADGSLGMMADTFVQCTNLATSCDGYTGTSQYITGYESYWDGHVSCKPNTISMTFDGTTTMSCDYGGTFTVPPPPAPRRGYVFTGWVVNPQPAN